MSRSSQQRAVANFRNRLAEKGLVRFEVTGRDSDRELVRAVARRLTEGGPDSDRLRAAVKQNVGGEPPKKRRHRKGVAGFAPDRLRVRLDPSA